MAIIWRQGEWGWDWAVEAPQGVGPSHQNWRISIADPIVSTTEGIELDPATPGFHALPATEDPGGICLALQQLGNG